MSLGQDDGETRDEVVAAESVADRDHHPGIVLEPVGTGEVGVGVVTAEEVLDGTGQRSPLNEGQSVRSVEQSDQTLGNGFRKIGLQCHALLNRLLNDSKMRPHPITICHEIVGRARLAEIEEAQPLLNAESGLGNGTGDVGY